MLEIKNISKRYRNGNEVFIALDDVSLSIKKGEFVVITGPSGAGKSTLLNVIGGLINPDSGEVKFNSRDIYKQKSRENDKYRKQNVGFMFQQFNLMPYLTVFENIKLACNNRQHSESINNYLEKCSLSALKHKYPSQLSVGEKQRTAFIRAIISNPDLLLADEPTGNLDPGNSSILMSLVEDYHRSGGTVVVVSHDPASVSFSDVFVRLEKGKILNS